MTLKEKRFLAATPEKKRVLIAKDVLSQLEAKKYKSKSGFWIKFPNKFELPEDSNASLQKVLTKDAPVCSVCAIGGLLASTIRLGNTLTVGDVEADDYEYCDGYSSIKYDEDSSTGIFLEKYFDKEQIMLMEIAFEEGSGLYSPYYSSLKYTDGDTESKDYIAVMAKLFAKKMKCKAGSTKLLKSIMENLIANKGEFIP